jgi:hypothetical protein
MRLITCLQFYSVRGNRVDGGSTMVWSAQPRELRMYLRTTPAPVRWYRSRPLASRHTGRRRRIKSFWSWPRRAMSRSVGLTGRVFVTVVRAVWFRGRLSMDRSRSKNRPTANFSSAAHKLITDSRRRHRFMKPDAEERPLAASGGSGRRISDRSRRDANIEGIPTIRSSCLGDARVG